MLLFFCISINAINVFASPPGDIKLQGEEELNITMGGLESVNRHSYEINGVIFLVDIFEFHSIGEVDEIIEDYRLELDNHKMNFNSSIILYYENYIEWFSGKYFISIKHDTVFEPNILVSYYLGEFPSSFSLPPKKEMDRMDT